MENTRMENDGWIESIKDIRMESMEDTRME